MRKTDVLFRQNLGWTFREQWKLHRKRVIRETGANNILQEMGIPLVDARAAIKPVFEEKVINITGYKPKELKHDSSHPDYHEEPCLMFEDNNVLLEGLEQAKLLTNTVEVEEETLPSSISTYFDSKDIPLQDKLVRRCIKSSLLFETEQKKLPKKTDPERPAWNFPRDYGITDRRRNYVLCNKLIQLCLSVSPEINSLRRVLNDGIFGVPLKRFERNIFFNLRADLLVMSSKPLKPYMDPKMSMDISLPVLDPVSPLISLEKKNIFRLADVHPLLEGASHPFVQTALVHYNGTEIGNLFETEVNETQILGRSLMKSFTFAASQARYLYGKGVVDLPTPIVMQCIQTDGRNFHFSVLQLNTLKEEGPIHNIYWCLPRIQLFELCDYVEGRPVLEGYNPDVFKLLLAFYRSRS